jgi:hypothetical protein
MGMASFIMKMEVINIKYSINKYNIIIIKNNKYNKINILYNIKI